MARASARGRRCCGSRWGEWVALTRFVRHRQFGKTGIVGVDDVPKPAHVVDAEPFQLGVLVADVGRLATVPRGDGVDVMARVAIEFSPSSTCPPIVSQWFGQTFF